jgi:hypothetical protein
MGLALCHRKLYYYKKNTYISGTLPYFLQFFLHKVTTRIAKIDNLLALVVLLIIEIEVGRFFVTWFFRCLSLVVRRWRKITQFLLEIFFWVAVKSL